MDAFTSCLIFVSALAGDRRQRLKKLDSKSDENSECESAEDSQTCTRKAIRMSLGYYVLLNFTYFALMALLVVALRHYPTYIIYIQHMAVVGFIMIAFDGWFRPAIAYPTGIALSLAWFFSGSTAYRWILNNIIIVIFTLMVGDIQFKNFAVLQIFMWSAFIYDVCVLAGSAANFAPSLFSVGIEECDTLICHLFKMHDKWELPSVFTMKFGNATQVFLGTGDILLGALVVNFSKSFFKTTKYVVAVVLSFSFALGLLSQVESMPFPALATIVPVCTSAIILCAFISGKTRQLFSVNKDASSREQIGLLIA